jgi:hypothetical protein
MKVGGNVSGFRGFKALLRIPDDAHRIAPGITVTASFLLQRLNLDCVLECVDVAGRSGADRIAFLAPDYIAIDHPAERGEAFGWLTPSARAHASILPNADQVNQFSRRIPHIHKRIAKFPRLDCANNSLERIRDYLQHFVSNSPPDRLPVRCGVIAEHAVVTVEGRLRVCWLSPKSFSIQVSGDPFLQAGFVRAKNLLLNDSKNRNRSCGSCMQGIY